MTDCAIQSLENHAARERVDNPEDPDMFLCMRTTIDMPDSLMKRAKGAMAKRGMTFRALVIDALEQSLRDHPEPFVLKEASAGYKARKGAGVSGEQINQAIDELRQPKSAR